MQLGRHLSLANHLQQQLAQLAAPAALWLRGFGVALELARCFPAYSVLVPGHPCCKGHPNGSAAATQAGGWREAQHEARHRTVRCFLPCSVCSRANEAIPQPVGRLNPMSLATHTLPCHSGGFACCYDAKWERGAETRRIALKVLLPAHSSPDCLYWTQFLQEAALLLSVQHRWGTAPSCSCNRSYAGRTDVEAACTSSRSAVSLPSRWSLPTPLLIRRTIVKCFDLVELPASQPGLRDTYSGPTLAMLLELVQVCMQQHMDCFHVGGDCTWKAACTCAAGCGCCRCLPSVHVRPRPLQQQLLCTHQRQLSGPLDA